MSSITASEWFLLEFIFLSWGIKVVSKILSVQHIYPHFPPSPPPILHKNVCVLCVCVLNPCVLNVSVETNGANICYFSDLYIETLRNMEATMKRGRSPGLRRQYQTDWPSPPLPPRQAHNTQSSYDTQGTVKRFSSATNDLCLVLKSLIFIWCCQSY